MKTIQHDQKGEVTVGERALADSIPQLVWIADADGRIFWYNRRWYEYTGTTEEQMAGWGWQSVHDPAVLPRVVECWQRFIAAGEAFELEFPLRSASGDFRWFLTRVAPVRDASGAITRWYGTNTDISEIREAGVLLRASQERLQESERRLRVALDSADMGTWDWNIETGELVWSYRCRELFGFSPNQPVTYEGFLLAIHGDDRSGVDRAVQEAIEQKKDYSATMRVPGQSGIVRWVLATGRALCDESGNCIRLTGVAQDITERHLVEERVRQTQKLESMGLLAGGVAHDFNNLLTGIMCGASIALDAVNEASPIYSVLRTVLISSERAAELTRQMLAYSGKGRFQVEFVDLSKKVRKTLPLVEHFISKKVVIRQHLSDSLPPIEADKSQVEQVIMNLLTNAGEAIGDSYGTIEIETGVEHIDDHSSEAMSRMGVDLEAGSYVTLEVRDTGCGMTQEQQARIFDPFFTTKATGRGLGLAAIHGIVRGHKGAIQIASKPGGGTTFRVFFRAASHGGVAVSGAPTTPDTVLLRNMPCRAILVVDDEEMVRQVAQSALQAQGHRVLLAGGAREALDLLNRHLDEIEPVLLDVSMPGLGGREMLPLLRAIKPSIQVIVSSGFSESEVLKQFAAEQISGFLHKPYLGVALVRAVAAACGKKGDGMTRMVVAAFALMELARAAAEPQVVFDPARVQEVYRVLLDRDALLLESIMDVIKQKDIHDGQVTVTAGSVQECTYHYVTSTAKRASNAFKTVKGPFEILNAGGMIADGEPHLHITLSSAAKGAFGGHLEKGCRVLYLAEVTIVKYSGAPLVRKDNENGISILGLKNGN